MSGGEGDRTPALAPSWGPGCCRGGKAEGLLSPTPSPPHHTEVKLTPCFTPSCPIAPQKATKGWGGGGAGGSNNIRENMCSAKNNHCVMRKQNWAASGASAGYIQEGGGSNSPGSVVRHSG